MDDLIDSIARTLHSEGRGFRESEVDAIQALSEDTEDSNYFKRMLVSQSIRSNSVDPRHTPKER